MNSDKLIKSGQFSKSGQLRCDKCSNMVSKRYLKQCGKIFKCSKCYTYLDYIVEKYANK